MQANDTESMKVMAELQQQFGEVLGDKLAAIEAAVSGLAFDLALPHCQTLLEKYADGTQV